jgi:uncharacterized membrane protein
VIELLISSVVTALASGALAKAKNIGVHAITIAYDSLKKAVIEEVTGKSGAVQALEEEPDSEEAQSMLAKQLGKQNITQINRLQQLAQQLLDALEKAKADGVPRAAEIDVGEIRGHVNAKVSDLVATGSIKLRSVIAETGDATVEKLRAGVRGEDDSKKSNG